MDERQRGSVLVTAQLACAAALFLPGRRLWPPGPATRVTASCLVAGGLGLSAAGAAGLGRRLRAHPEPPPDAVLRTDGVYALVRHPIYAGLVTAAAGVCVERGRAVSWVAGAALVGVLRAKTRREEALLARRFGAAYDAYRAVTPGWAPSRRHR